MSRINLIQDEDGILDALNDSDFGGDSDEDENWMPPGEDPDSLSDEDQEDDDRAPVVSAPAAKNTWTRRMFRGKPMPSVTTIVEEVCILFINPVSRNSLYYLTFSTHVFIFLGTITCRIL